MCLASENSAAEGVEICNLWRILRILPPEDRIFLFLHKAPCDLLLLFEEHKLEKNDDQLLLRLVLLNL